MLSAIAALLVGCGGGSDKTTLHVIEHANTDTLQHIGPANEDDSIGDVLGFANPLFDANNKNKVGSDNGSCIRTAVGKAFECVWTATLSGGQLTVEGPFYDAKDSTLAITGGSGTYDEARGEMTLHARNDQGTEYDFTYEIVK
jgi:allene oxide cyclase